MPHTAVFFLHSSSMQKAAVQLCVLRTDPLRQPLPSAETTVAHMFQLDLELAVVCADAHQQVRTYGEQHIYFHIC